MRTFVASRLTSLDQEDEVVRIPTHNPALVPIPPEPSSTPSPFRLLSIVAATVFAGEALVMIIFFPMTDVNPILAGIFDATLITILILPCLYFFFLRPLTQQITARQRYETALYAANELLEQRVEERTEELRQVNQALLHEVSEHRRAEEALRQAHDHMEQQVQERTQDLAQSNKVLLDLSEAERAQRRLAEALVQSTLALCASLNLNEVLDHILAQIAQVTPYHAAAVFLLQDDWVEVPRHRRFNGAKHTHELADGFPLARVPQLSLVAETQQPLLVNDAGLDPNWVPIAGLEWIRSCFIVPLVDGNHVIGFLATVSDEPSFFQEKSVSTLTAFAAHATVAVQNAWLFQQVRTGHQRLQSLSHRLVETQEAERRYIARELHDEAGQSLTSLLVGLRHLENNASRPESVVAAVRELRRCTEEIMEGLHRLAVNLRPASLDHLGLVAALDSFTSRLKEHHGLQARFKAVGLEEHRLPLNLETALYRIAQEALTNVIRHANASLVDVLLHHRADKVTLTIEDNGVGFQTAEIAKSERLGLVGARERCEMLGGFLSIESQPTQGTTIIAEIPYADSYPIC